VSNNVFAACEGSQPTVSTGMLFVPYEYTLEPVMNVPTVVVRNAGVGTL
jgi:pectate lyase